MLKKIIAVVSLALLLPSCAARKTVFLSEPPGASISVNGELIGETPCEYRYSTGAGKVYEIAVRKADYQPVEGQIAAEDIDKESRDKWMVAGLLWSPLWLGTLFTKKLKDTYHFVLTRIKAADETSEDEDSPTQRITLKKEPAPQPPLIVRKPS